MVFHLSQGARGTDQATKNKLNKSRESARAKKKNNDQQTNQESKRATDDRPRYVCVCTHTFIYTPMYNHVGVSRISDFRFPRRPLSPSLPTSISPRCSPLHRSRFPFLGSFYFLFCYVLCHFRDFRGCSGCSRTTHGILPFFSFYLFFLFSFLRLYSKISLAFFFLALIFVKE